MTNTKQSAPSRQLSIRMPSALHDALVKAAAENGLTLAAFIKHLAAKQINHERKQAKAA